jgi:hypothetical protein
MANISYTLREMLPCVNRAHLVVSPLETFWDVEAEDWEEEISWPYLTTSLDVACQRAHEHRASFLSVFTDQQALYDQWTRYFERLATNWGGYIHIKTYDVSQLWDDVAFDAYLIACLEAFAHNRWEDWLVLLEQSDVEYEPGPPIRILIDSRVRDIGGILRSYNESGEPDVDWPDAS